VGEQEFQGGPSNTDIDEEHQSYLICNKVPLQIWASSLKLDIMIIGNSHGNRVRRQGSVMPMISDTGRDDSALSSTSSGLRRKPIPLLLLTGLA